MLQIILESIDAARGEALQRKTIELHKASTTNSKEFYKVAQSLRDEAKELVSVFSNHKFGKKDVENLLRKLIKRTKEAEFFDYVGAEQAIMGITSVLAAADQMGLKKSTNKSSPRWTKFIRHWKIMMPGIMQNLKVLLRKLTSIRGASFICGICSKVSEKDPHQNNSVLRLKCNLQAEVFDG